MPLRDHRTGRAIALDVIPEWTRGAEARRAIRGSTGVLGNHAEQHAATVWTEARAATATRAAALRQQAGTNDPSGLIALEFVSRVAGHLVNCQRCHRETGSQPGTPETWLLYAIGQRPRLKATLGPILRELGHRPARMPPGTAQAASRAARAARTV